MNIVKKFRSFISPKKIKIEKVPASSLPGKHSILSVNNIPTINPEIEDYFSEIYDLDWDIKFKIGTIGNKSDSRFSDRRYRECIITISREFKFSATSNYELYEKYLNDLKLELSNSIFRLEKNEFMISTIDKSMFYEYTYLLPVGFSNRSHLSHQKQTPTNINFDEILSRMKKIHNKDQIGDNPFDMDRIIEFCFKIYLM